MTHKLKTEMFSQRIEYSGGVFFWPLTPLFGFVSFHLNRHICFLKHVTTFSLGLLSFHASIVRQHCFEKCRHQVICISSEPLNIHFISYLVYVLNCFQDGVI